MIKKHCFVLLCGLPASGKTLFVQEVISNKCWYSSYGEKCKLIHVCYDELIPRRIEQDHSTCNEVASWKQWRQHISTMIESSLRHCEKSGCYPKGDAGQDTLVSWCRTNILPLVDAVSDDDDDILSVLFFDDNMYYRSMRYQIYQLSRSLSAGFCQLYMRCPLDTCLERNASRPAEVKVPTEVIMRMEERLEPPLPKLYHWESKTAVIDVCDRRIESINKAIQLIQEAINDPITMKMPKVDIAQLEESRRQNSTNFLHQVDQILRQLVSATLTSDEIRTLPREGMRELSRRATEAKRETLEEIKNGSLVPTQDVGQDSTDASKHPDSPLYRYISMVFHAKIS